MVALEHAISGPFCTRQRELEHLRGRGEKGGGGIPVGKMNLAHRENDLRGQGRFSWGKLGERMRNPFLDIHVQFEPAFFDKHHVFPDADR